MRQRIAELLCLILGHRSSVYDTDLYGPVLVCDRCLHSFDYHPDDV